MTHFKQKAALAISLAFVACSVDIDEIPSAECRDFLEGTTREHYGMEKEQFCDSRDGKVYVYVTIGTQTWMAENLAYEAKGSRCYGEGGKIYVGYDYDTKTTIDSALSDAEIQANCEKYGRLYDWETAKKVCPSGWHLPNMKEHEALIESLGGIDARPKPGMKLKTTSGWDDYYSNDGTYAGSGNGTDDFGFAALPGGRFYEKKYFRNRGTAGFLHLSDEVYRMEISKYAKTFFTIDVIGSARSDNSTDGSYLSIRCVRD